MLGAIVLLGVAALAATTPRRRARGLGDAPALPSGDAQSVYLLRPADFAHPARRAAVEAQAQAQGGPWAVVPASGWAGAKYFGTARQGRTALRAAGFRGPVGKGQSSRWSR